MQSNETKSTGEWRHARLRWVRGRECVAFHTPFLRRIIWFDLTRLKVLGITSTQVRDLFPLVAPLRRCCRRCRGPRWCFITSVHYIMFIFYCVENISSIFQLDPYFSSLSAQLHSTSPLSASPLFAGNAGLSDATGLQSNGEWVSWNGHCFRPMWCLLKCIQPRGFISV